VESEKGGGNKCEEKKTMKKECQGGEKGKGRTRLAEVGRDKQEKGKLKCRDKGKGPWGLVIIGLLPDRGKNGGGGNQQVTKRTNKSTQEKNLGLGFRKELNLSCVWLVYRCAKMGES